MTQLPDIPQDDLMDIVEMADKIESYIDSLLKENEKNIAISALLNAYVNFLLRQCETLDEAMFFRRLLIQMLDGCIKTIRIQAPEKPPSS